MKHFKLSAFLIFVLIAVNGFTQTVVVNGSTLLNSGGAANNCVANGYKLKGTAIPNGNCVSLTQNTFDAGAMWICDPINLNQSFKVYFEANFDAFNSGDGLAFVLQTVGVPSVLGGEGGGMGYTYGNLTGCIPAGSCNIDPSVVVEFDIWNNVSDFWNVGNPASGTINDVACDHATILVDGNQTTGGTLAGPNCLLPGNVNVTDGLIHDICIIWDVVNLQYAVYFDSALVTTYNGDIRTNFANPASVNWGFTAGSGGANQNQRVCNVDMVTNPSNPSCICAIPVASFSPNPASVCTGNTTAIALSSTIPGTTYTWSATNNPNVSGESTTTQVGSTISQTLTNSTAVPQIVTYTVTPTVVGCATGADLIIPVTVYPAPTLTGNFTICQGSTSQLTGSGTQHPILPWVSSNFGVATVTNTGLVTAISPGTSVITYMNNNNCQITATVTVTPAPTPIISGANQYCAGAFSTLSTTIPYPTYSWSTGATSPTIDATITVNPITVTVTDASGCSGTSSVFTVSETSSSIYNSNVSICEGAVAIIHGNAETIAGIYTQSFVLASGCDSISNVTLIVNPLPTVFAGNDFAVCEGDQATLNGSGAMFYTWNPASVINGQAFTPTGTATYIVTGVDINGCVNTDQITVSIEPNPTVSFTADVVEGCAPLTVTFTNTTGGTLTNCLWTMENGATLSGCNSVTTTFQNAGIYDVTLETTSSNGCSNSETYLDFIYVEDVFAAFSASAVELSTSNQEVFFNNNSIQAINYFWNFGDNTATSTLENPSYIFNDAQANYVVQLIAYSSLGCVDTAELTLTVKEEPIFYVPNAFSPDGDEFNQLFQPVFTSGFDPYDFNLSIYNRWGELIWESFDASAAWDGVSNNTGKSVQDGIYTWKIEFKALSTDERIQVFGHVSVIR